MARYSQASPTDPEGRQSKVAAQLRQQIIGEIFEQLHNNRLFLRQRREYIDQQDELLMISQVEAQLQAKRLSSWWAIALTAVLCLAIGAIAGHWFTKNAAVRAYYSQPNFVKASFQDADWS